MRKLSVNSEGKSEGGSTSDGQDELVETNEAKQFFN
jgi:hypothetical protein